MSAHHLLLEEDLVPNERPQVPHHAPARCCPDLSTFRQHHLCSLSWALCPFGTTRHLFAHGLPHAALILLDLVGGLGENGLIFGPRHPPAGGSYRDLLSDRLHGSEPASPDRGDTGGDHDVRWETGFDQRLRSPPEPGFDLRGHWYP